MPKALEYRYPLRLPTEDSAGVLELSKASGHSINDVLLVAIRKGMAEARRTLTEESARLTNVEPYTAPAAKRIYSQPDRDSKLESQRVKGQPGMRRDE